MAHIDCLRQDEISTMQSEIKHLQEYTDDDKNWKRRMEDKIDKILWFFLGQSVGLIITVVGGVVIYAISQ